MPANRSIGLVSSLQRLVRPSTDESLTDSELLDRFLTDRDESAFATLVHRYGPLVLGVCRRLLHNLQDAEDAFQATFLVFLLKARPITNPNHLANWLYGVAYHTAQNARTSLLRRQARERAAAEMYPRSLETLNDDAWEWKSILDDELNRLPEKYRAPVILCELSGLSRKEAARRLGCPEGTISSRLARAHDQLQARLLKRGVVLSAGALATAISTEGVSAAVPPSLAMSTVRIAFLTTACAGPSAGVIPIQVAALARHAMRRMLLGKLKTVASFALLGFLVTAVGVVWGRANPDQPMLQASVDAVAHDNSANPQSLKAQDVVVFTGKVLDPDGKPIAGARLYALKTPTTKPKNELDIDVPERGVTDAEGRFRIVLPRSDLDAGGLVKGRTLPLVAAADGYGIGWTAIPKGKAPADLTLQLVRDETVRGRVVTTEGKPVAGAIVKVIAVSDFGTDGLKGFLDVWKSGNSNWQAQIDDSTRTARIPLTKVVRSSTTDKDGKFQIVGTGANRFVVLALSSPTISDVMLFVINQAGFDPAADNKETPVRGLRPPPVLLYGPDLNHVAMPALTIKGTVTEAGTNKPIPGITVAATSNNGGPIQAVTDAQGRYSLRGLSKSDQHLLYTFVDKNSPWLRGGARVMDQGGLEPLQANIELARGVILRGKVVDKRTGKGVQSGVRFVPLPGNPFFDKPGYDSTRFEKLMESTDADGRFRLVVMPGQILLMAQVHAKKDAQGTAVNPYRHAVADPEHKNLFQNDGTLTVATAGGGIEPLGVEANACRVLDLKQGAEATTELVVDPGVTTQIEIQDASGAPLPGCWVSGLSESWPIASKIPTAKTILYALTPDKPRSVAIVNNEKKLGGVFSITGQGNEPTIVKLGPLSKATGQLVDDSGAPLEGVTVAVSPHTEAVQELYRFANPNPNQATTDKQGRFVLEGLLPEMSFNLYMVRQKQQFEGKPRIGIMRARPGETLELGEHKVEVREK